MTRGSRAISLSGAALVVAVFGTLGASHARPLHHCRHCSPVFLDPYGLGVPPPPGPAEPPQLLFPDEPPFLAPDQAPFFVQPSNPPFSEINPPYPQGFVLNNVPTATGDGSVPDRPTGKLNRYKQVADTLAACWRPPATFDGKRWEELTLRVSFKRDGSLNGMPRIPFASQSLTPDARSGLTQSLNAALIRCTPLALSPSLGAAIAGQIFALRFIQQDPPL